MPLRSDRLRETREARGLTQRDLATLSGINEYQISRYENGKSDPSTAFLELIARHLDVSADFLIGLSDYPHGQFGETLEPEQSQLLKAFETGDSATIMELVSARLRQLTQQASSE
jgi:transcriptional regulator with XRE-family HTH domain